MTLSFGMEDDFDIVQAGIEIQGHRLKVKVTQWLNIFWLHSLSLFTLLEVKVKCRGQRAKVKVKGATCSRHQYQGLGFRGQLALWARSTITSVDFVSQSNSSSLDWILPPCNYCHHPWCVGNNSYHKAISIMFICNGISDHASLNEVFHYWDTKLSW